MRTTGAQRAKEALDWEGGGGPYVAVYKKTNKRNIPGQIPRDGLTSEIYFFLNPNSFLTCYSMYPQR